MDIKSMSLRQKVAQMIVCGFDGTEPSEGILKLIREQGVGGVIYFARNVKDISQVARLSNGLQEAAKEAGIAPLWISIDQEGGMVARITEGVALMPGQMAIAAAGRSDWAYEAGAISGRELRALGINLNYAPDLDVNNNADNPVIGVRSFGESPELVAEYGCRLMNGLQDAGVVATAKHFPGHGDTNVDSHLDLPTVGHSRERMEQVELVPFRRAIAEGVDAVMSAHIYFPALESEKLPVTLSHKVLTGLLREELGFNGVIMTDCMEMHAISKHYGTVEASVMAVEAGADIVLISHTHEWQAGAIDAILKAVESGRLTEERIDQSVARLLALKQKRGLYEASAAGTDGVGIAEHKETARQISEASITVVKNEAGVLPLTKTDTFVISLETQVVTMVDDALSMPLTLGGALREVGVEVTEASVPLADVEARIEELLKQAAAYGQVVVGTYNASFSAGQIRLVQELQKLGSKLVVVATRNPYDLLKFPEVKTFVAAYESRPLALRSAAKALVGAISAEGRLPVTLGEQHPAGVGGKG